MSDGVFPDRVTLLRNRWEADPSSRVFLQLAEEYRHQGHVKEALDVLDQGLKEHPGYLSALVAKGRCHLELGEPEPARTVLERVVKQDATQMVANKLLVRAYLDTGEPERARERLDLYSLLTDGDPEIDELRRRLHAMEQSPQPVTPGSTPPPPLDSPLLEASASTGERRDAAPPGEDIFELSFPTRPVAAARLDEPFADLLPDLPPDLPPLAPTVAAPTPVAPTAAAPAPMAPAVAPAPVAASVPAAAAIAEAAPEPGGVLFPGLASVESRRRYLSGLAAEGLFVVDLTAVAPAAAAPAPAEQAAPAAAEAEEEAPVFDLTERTPWAAAPEPLEPEPLELEEAAAPAAPRAEPAATMTLGELYLRQGHLGEAERIFREILRREPGHAAAREGLTRAAAQRAERGPLTARDLLAGYEPSAEGEAETKARRAWLLNSYLTRLRQGNQRDVS
jgi:tetratricopeptide (TPR) repeat protein